MASALMGAAVVDCICRSLIFVVRNMFLPRSLRYVKPLPDFSMTFWRTDKEIGTGQDSITEQDERLF